MPNWTFSWIRGAGPSLPLRVGRGRQFWGIAGGPAKLGNLGDAGHTAKPSKAAVRHAAEWHQRLVK